MAEVVIAALAGRVGWRFLESVLHCFPGDQARTHPNSLATQQVRAEHAALNALDAGR